MFKKFTFALLTALLSLMATAQTEAFQDGNFWYRPINDTEAEIVKDPSGTPYNTIKPDWYKSTVTNGNGEFTVVAIGEHAFDGATYWLTNSTGKTHNSTSTFACINLTTLREFKAYSLTNFDAPIIKNTTNLTNIDPKAFYGNKVRRIFFNGSDTYDYVNLNDVDYGILTSKDHTKLVAYPGKMPNNGDINGSIKTTVSLPSDFITIGAWAFGGNSNLKTITVKSVTIEEGAFEGSAVQTFNGGNVLETIGDSAFANCAALTTVTLPETLATIGEDAFANSALTSFTVPVGVTTLGPGFIAGAKNISEIGVDEGNANFQAINGCVYTKAMDAAPALKDAEGMTLVAVPYGATVLEVADGTTAIGSKAAYNGQLETLSLPASLETIGENAFMGNHGITTIYCDAINAPAGANFEEEVFAAELVLAEGANIGSYANDPVWSKFELPEPPVPTGVIDLNTTVTKAQSVYTVDGRLVRQNAISLEGLDAGLYIMGGKKYIVK